MIYALKIVLVVVVCYLIGNINNALIISKIKRRDIRTEGSGNPGAMNMFRNFGTGWGFATLFLDALKGAIGCVFGCFVLGGKFAYTSLGMGAVIATDLGMYVGGLSVIVGHIFPVFLKFRGGKGIASSIGVCLTINPVITLITGAIGLAFIVVTKMGAITSFIIIAYPLAFAGMVAAKSGDLARALLVLGIFCLTLFCHRKNIYKLFRGSENKTRLFKKHRRNAK